MPIHIYLGNIFLTILGRIGLGINNNDLFQGLRGYSKNLFDKMNPIIENYMNQNTIDILLDRKNVYIGNVGSDITKKIIDEVNKNIK